MNFNRINIKPRLNKQRIRLLLVAFLSALVAFGLLAYMHIVPVSIIGTGSSTEKQSLPTVETDSSFDETDLEKFMNSHGPWLTTEESIALRNTAGVRNLALFNSNGLNYSSLSVEFEANSPWTKVSTPPQIKGVSIAGTILIINTQKGLEHTLNVTQPFMVEGNLSRVFVIDNERNLWSASPANLNFVEAEKVADPSLPINPYLSIGSGN